MVVRWWLESERLSCKLQLVRGRKLYAPAIYDDDSVFDQAIITWVGIIVVCAGLANNPMYFCDAFVDVVFVCAPTELRVDALTFNTAIVASRVYERCRH